MKTCSFLPSVYYLFQKKETEFENLINAMLPLQISNEKEFINIIQLTKKQILLEPVLFSNPEIRRIISEENTVSTPKDFNQCQNLILVSVDFYFEGDAELFRYMPDNNLFLNQAPNLYQPSFGDFLSVKIKIPKFNKTIAIAHAKAILDDTFSLITQMNMEVQNWSLLMEAKINLELHEKRMIV